MQDHFTAISVMRNLGDYFHKGALAVAVGVDERTVRSWVFSPSSGRDKCLLGGNGTCAAPRPRDTVCYRWPRRADLVRIRKQSFSMHAPMLAVNVIQK